MLKRKILIFIFSLLLIFSLVGQISANFSSLDVTNEFQNGIVDIEVGQRKTENNMVLPYDEIYEDAYIKNNGADCYIRTKFTFSNENIVNDTNISGMSSDWVFVEDGYYYYTKVLRSNESISLFKSLKIGDIDDEFQLSNFTADICVDAIQSKNFVADFTSKKPWGEVEILKVNNSSNITEYKSLPDTSFNIIYNDDVKGMVKNFDSFFNDVENLMPGDCYEDVLEIQNNTNKEQVVYFSTKCTTNEKFLNHVVFTIINDNGDVVLGGNLGENKEIMLDVLEAYTNSKITFRIEVPKSINNEFVLDKSAVKWAFSTKNIEDISVPQTGYKSHTGIYIALACISIIGLIFSVKGMKKYDKKDY